MKPLAVALACLAASGACAGQTTDAFHSIQVIPIAVDTASYIEQITFSNPDKSRDGHIAVAYFPAQGTSQLTALDCGAVTVPAGGTTTFPSLRALCPALPPGSQFGVLYANATGLSHRPFAVHGKAENQEGMSFVVEGFAASEFTSAPTAIEGVRRRAAMLGSPAIQTNCFVGELGRVNAPADKTPSIIGVAIHAVDGTEMGTTAVEVAPGRLTRLLDVFAAAGIVGTDVPSASVRFSNLTASTSPSLITFCTEQENTHFSGALRIGKQQWSASFAKDGLASRATISRYPVSTSTDPLPRRFELRGGLYRNTHVIYFRHPDWIQCELLDQGERALPSYGLEMRLYADDGLTLIAGGAMVTGFGDLYLGDKQERGGGTNTRYTIEVQSNGENIGPYKNYDISCRSGSGHTNADLIAASEAIRP